MGIAVIVRRAWSVFPPLLCLLLPIACNGGGDGISAKGRAGGGPAAAGVLDEAGERRVEEVLGGPVGRAFEAAADSREAVQVRFAAIKRLEGERSAEAVAVLGEIAGRADAPSIVADNAVAALVRMQTPEGRAVLAGLARTATPDVRRLVVDLVGHMGTRDDLAVLDAAAADPVLVARAGQARGRVEERGR